MNKNKKKNFKLILQLLIVIALAVNIVLLLTMNKGADKADTEELKIIFLITPDCENCFDLEPFREYFKENDVSDEQFVEHDFESFSGKRLLKKYEITQVPTIIITGDVSASPFMADLVENIGEMRKNAFVVTRLQPPFYDIETDEIRGLFDVIYLADKSCEECYDVKLNDEVFERLGLFGAQNLTELDIEDEKGKLLIEAYAIEAVPTVILTGDLAIYESIQDVWSEVGSVEDDGAYILRQGVVSMGVYKQLPEGSIIEPQEVDEDLPLE